MRLLSIRHLLSFAWLGLTVAVGCGGNPLSPVPPVVTPSTCSTLTTCGQCSTNVVCGWCGDANTGSCMAATSAAARQTAPATCTAKWTWELGTCPAQGNAPPPPPPPPPATK